MNGLLTPVPCLAGYTVCKSVHSFNMFTKETDYVIKTCAKQEECALDHVGCDDTDDSTECVTCCTEDYCNEDVPTDQLSAVLLSVLTTTDMTSSSSLPEFKAFILTFLLLLWVI